MQSLEREKLELQFRQETLELESELAARARRLLRSKYGQPHNIATAFIDKVTNGPSIKADDSVGLSKFAVSLTSCKNTLRDIGLASRVQNPDTLQKIVGRLPMNLKLKWRDEADRITEELQREITFEDLAKFVEREARVATHPVFGKIERDNANKQSQFNAPKLKSSPNPPKIAVFACQGEPSVPKVEEGLTKGCESVSSAATINMLYLQQQSLVVSV